MTRDERETNQAAWAERIAEFRESNLSAPQWCETHGLKIHQFRYWYKKLGNPAPQTVRWLPVGLSDPEPTLTVKVGPAAIVVRDGFDPQLFIAVVKILGTL